MEVARETAKSLLLELGNKSAANLTDSRLIARLQKLPDTLDDESADQVESPDAVKLLKAIQKDPSILEDVEIVDAETNGHAKTKKGGKKATAVEPEDEVDEDEVDENEVDENEEEEEDEEDEEEASADEEDEEEEEAPAKAKKGKAKAGKAGAKKGKGPQKAGGEGKPGIIASIVEFIGEATKDKPITKDKLVARLAKRFPDREESSLKSTVAQQVPTKLRNEKGLNIERHEDGGYFVAAKKKAGKK